MNESTSGRTAGVREGGTVRITLMRSLIGSKQDQIATVKALGLNRVRSTVERPDSVVLRGMIFKIKHLVAVEDL
jgi:large subunit ribosomal protein L30